MKLIVPVIGAALKGVIQAGSLHARTEGILVLETRPENYIFVSSGGNRILEVMKKEI